MYKLKLYLVVSTCFHALFLVLVIFYLNFIFTLAEIGGETDKLETYTYQEAKIVSAKPSATAIKPEKALPLIKKKPAPIATTETQASLSSQKSGKEKNALLTLLHEAIQKHQHYPLSAQEMEQEGRTRLQFTLYQNGNISHLRITQSSGITSLDQAALAAVQAALPFQGVEIYLDQAEEYSVDVIFSR